MIVTRIATVLLAIVVAVIALVWQFPARGLLLVLPSTALSSPLHRVHAIEGRLWRGAMSLSVAALPTLQRIEWQCELAPLSASIDCALSGSLNGTVTLRPFAGVAVAQKLDFVSALDYRANSNVAVTSESLSVQIDTATLSRTRLELKGSAIAKDWVVASPALVPPRASLGEVFVECLPDTANAASNCTVKNRASATRIDGNIELTLNRVRGALEIASPGAAPLKFGF
ncbi:MAG: hypothetical protein EAZ21_10615 [Betaproteobacteria bacterium]|nr:MAG: hypothetical protein EAZ21_10615 [Betaproteobacteria bacterium]